MVTASAAVGSATYINKKNVSTCVRKFNGVTICLRNAKAAKCSLYKDIFPTLTEIDLDVLTVNTLLNI